MGEESLQHLALKTVFLIALKSAEGIDELNGLMVDLHFALFHGDQVVSHSISALLPKVVQNFHLNQAVSLISVLPQTTSITWGSWII